MATSLRYPSPYTPPPLQKGDRTHCFYRDALAVITSWSDGRILQRLMRHSDLRITMDYYANIDQAVEEAVLGPQRNTSRNTPPAPANPPTNGVDVNPY